MNTFIINLRQNTTRKDNIISGIKKTNIDNYDFFEAVDGNCDNELNKYEFSIMENWHDPYKDRYITVGEIGCALSHYNIWEFIYKNNIQSALILEDDIVFDDNFNNMFEYVKRLDLDYDLLYLSRNSINNNTIEIEVNEHIVIPKMSYNAHSYIITHKCASKLLKCNYLKHLIPVDEFLCMMYDVDYPYKIYNEYFKKYDMLNVLALKKNITDQLSNSSCSSTENTKIYDKPIYDIPPNENIFHSTTLDLNLPLDKRDMYTVLTNNIIESISDLNLNFKLRQNVDEYCFFEKLIYEIANYHCNRLNININNTHIVFWSKKREYNFDHIHTHVDHCDYEYRICKTKNIKPILTTLTYFNDNDSPTIITDINMDMKNQQKFSKSKKFMLSFPRCLKHISFDSNYIHGESYIKDYNTEGIRKTLVVSLWDINNCPLHVPYYDNTFIMYHLFINKNIAIEEPELFNKKFNIFDFLNTDKNTIKIPITDNEIINEGFFNELIINRKKNVIYPLKVYVDKYENYDNLIFDFSNIFIKNVCDGVEEWNITHCSDKRNEITNIKHINNFIHTENTKKEYLLDTSKNRYSILEKYVYDIAILHKTRLNIEDTIYISFYANEKSAHISMDNNEQTPFLTIATFFESSINPFIITHINNEMYKYKEFINTDFLLIYPNKLQQIIFEGGKYHFSNDKCLIVQLWINKPFFSVYSPNENIIIDSKCKLMNINKLINKPIDYDVDIKYVNDFFNDYLYKKINNKLIKEIGKSSGSYLVKFKEIHNDNIIHKDETYTQMSKPTILQKIKFDPSVF